MTSGLVVGDVHGQLEDLADCEALHSLVVKTCKETSPDFVAYLGDQYHNHAVKHVEVERFWMASFAELRRLGIPVIALVGNHDRPGNAASTASAMQVHSDITVVDKPTEYAGFLFLPYYHNPKVMVQAAQNWPNAKVLFCHAAFSGGHYDNGVAIKADAFYGKDVVDPNELPQKSVISGHIHAPAKFGKVWYPGSPRWQTMGDANTERAIHLVEFDGAGVSSIPFDTATVCRRTWQLDYSPEDRCEAELAVVRPGDKVLMNIYGPQAFCEESKRAFAGRFRTRVFPTDRGVAKVSEAEGIPAAFEKHFGGYKPKFGTSKELLRNLVKERLHV